MVDRGLDMKQLLTLICLGIPLYAAVALEESSELECERSNEVQKCVDVCPPEKTCKNKDIKFYCLLNTDKTCQNKCVCKDGLLRNSVGDCISRENCDRCPEDDIYFSCGGFCQDVCVDLEEQSKSSKCPVADMVCNEKCYCNDGYYNDSQNNYIPINHWCCKRS